MVDLSTVKLVIELDKMGRMKVEGPIQDKVFSYGLLEAAKDQIREWHKKKSESPLVTLEDMGGVR